MTQVEPHIVTDISEFEALTARRDAAPPAERPAVEEERRVAIRRRYPSVTNLRWEVAFANNVELLGDVLRDILKYERAEPGRHGPRPGLDRNRDGPALDRMLRLDPTRHPYSLLSFPEAFRLLLGARSLRATANKLGLNVTRVYRLKEGLGAPPTMREMEQIAERLDRHPSYFSEYRAWAIHQAVIEQLDREPETSITVYERLWQRAGPAGRGTG